MNAEAILVDLDGTVYRGDSPVPGAPEAIERLRAAGLSVLFVSNNPVRSPAAYVDHLDSMGVQAREREVLTSGSVTTDYLRRNHPDARIHVVGADSLRTQFRDAGLTLVAEPSRADVLVGSWTESFDYGTLVSVLRGVDDETAFVGTDPDRTFPDDGGDLLPGSGAIIHALSGVLDREPDAILGKPSDRMLAAALEQLDVPAERCAVVGDRLSTDVAMGEAAGMTTVLVRSGVTDEATLAASDVTPDHVLADLGEVESVI